MEIWDILSSSRNNLQKNLSLSSSLLSNCDMKVLLSALVVRTATGRAELIFWSSSFNGVGAGNCLVKAESISLISQFSFTDAVLCDVPPSAPKLIQDVSNQWKIRPVFRLPSVRNKTGRSSEVLQSYHKRVTRRRTQKFTELYSFGNTHKQERFKQVTVKSPCLTCSH